MAKRNYNGSPIAFSDTINGAGNTLAQLDCSSGVGPGSKCFVATSLQFWTLELSAAVVDHISVEAALGFPAARWILDTAAGPGTVTSIGSADGSLVVTNPTTTPDLSVQVRTVANVAALAALATLAPGAGLQTGQLMWVQSSLPYGPQFYVLTTAVGTADGLNLVAASDDVTRQWMRDGMLDKSLLYISGEVDLTATSAANPIAPAITGRRITRDVAQYLVTAVGGNLTTPPSFNAGSNNPTNNNFIATGAQFSAASFAAGVGAFVGAGTATGLVYTPSTPLQWDVPVAATGTGGFVCKGRLIVTARYCI